MKILKAAGRDKLVVEITIDQHLAFVKIKDAVMKAKEQGVNPMMQQKGCEGEHNKIFISVPDLFQLFEIK